MAEISKIQLPSGNVYEIKDAVARNMISGGVSFVVAWNGSGTPTVANIPAGVVVTYNGTNYTGTLSANSAQAGAFYLVKSSTQKGGTLDVYDEYVPIGESPNKIWEKIGDTQLDLSDLGALAYKNSVTLNKGTMLSVLSPATTVTNSPSAVSFGAHSTHFALGTDATFSTTVTPTTTNVKATASGTAVGADGTDTFVKSYPGTTSKLATTTVPNVTGNTDVSVPNITANTSVTANKSTWTFTMGTGSDAETLIIGGGNGSDVTATNTTLGTANTASKVTLGTAKTVATGSLSASGSGGTVMTGLGTATTGSALTGVKVTTQPTVALSTGATAGTGVISVATGISSATTTANDKDEVGAITSLGAATAAAQTATVNGDPVSVANYNSLSISTN